MSSDFVTVKEAAEGFGKSDKTIYRLIDRITSEATHSDRHHVKPAPEEFAALKEQRKKIKYAISVELLAEKYGQPTAVQDTRSQSKQGTKQVNESTAINALYEQRIADLKEQLKQAHQREKELKSESQARESKLLDYAQVDKQLFAKANENLTQVLALPGITEATKAQRGSTVQDTTSTVVVTTTKPQTLEQKPRPNSETQAKPSPKKSNTTNKKEPDKAATKPRRSWFARKLFGTRKSSQRQSGGEH